MRPRLRRALAATATTTLVMGLAACGGDDSSEGQPLEGGLDTISISGDFGPPPEIEWDGRVSVDETESETLIEGDGPEVPEGASVMAQLVIANGYSQTTALSTWQDPPQQPQIFAPGAELPAGILAGFEGTTVGSRTATVAPPADAFGEFGNPQIGIGNFDSVLFVMDVWGLIENQVAEGDQQPPPGLPRIRYDEAGAVTRLGFEGADQPGDRLRVVTLAEGDGAPVEEDDFVAATYLGQVFDADEPFDTNFTAPEPDPNNPTAVPAEAGPTIFSLEGVVDGWQQGLVGVPVGSRVMLVIPPDLGYGEQGNEQAGIGGDDTLYFVIDVLGTSTAGSIEDVPEPETPPAPEAPAPEAPGGQGGQQGGGQQGGDEAPE